MNLLFLLTMLSSFTCQNLNKNIFYGESHMNYQLYGTMIVALICEDGILFASDSRSSFILNKEHSRKVYAYFDNDEKLFNIGKYIIGSSGISMLNKKFLKEIIDDYNKSSYSKTNMEETFDNFITFLKSNNNLTDSTIFADNEFIMAGYENYKPLIIAQDFKGKIIQGNIANMIHSYPEFRNFMKVDQDIKPTCGNITPLLECAIYNFAAHKSDHKIGGPLDIIKINPDNSHEIIKSFNPNHFKTYKEMAEAILNKKISVNYIFPFSEELLSKTLKEGIELGY